MLITQNPDLMKRMNAVSSTFVRSQWYTALRLHPERDNITSVTDEKVHTDPVSYTHLTLPTIYSV